MVALDVRVATHPIRQVCGNEIKVDGVEYIIMREDDVLGVLDAAAQAARRLAETIRPTKRNHPWQKQIITATTPPGDPARLNQLADAVKVTLGPEDGMSFSRRIRRTDDHERWRHSGQRDRVEDPLENMGTQMVREVGLEDLRRGRRRYHTATILAQQSIARASKRSPREPIRWPSSAASIRP